MAIITTGGLVEHSKKKDEEKEWKDTKAQLQSQTYMHRKPVTEPPRYIQHKAAGVN